MLDPALIRPGRIDRKIYVPPPDSLSREHILQLELKKMPVQDDLDLSTIIPLTEGFSGAEMVSICSEAAMLAIDKECDRISQEHLLQAVYGIKPQITKDMLEFYEQFQSTHRI